MRLTGLGTVTPLSTGSSQSALTVTDGYRRARGSGRAQGGRDPARIDPRPFQVQLAQAEGQAAKDEAALREREIDLQRTQALIDRDAASADSSSTRRRPRSISSKARCRATRAQIAEREAQSHLQPRSRRRSADAWACGSSIRATSSTRPIRRASIVITQLRADRRRSSRSPRTACRMVLPQVRTGRRLPVEALRPRLERSGSPTGSLLSVDNQIDQATGTVKLKADVSRTRTTRLFPNQFVNARLRGRHHSRRR